MSARDEESVMQLQRVGSGPVLTPRPEVAWEKDTVFNTAAIHDRGRFHLLYRAVAHNPGDRNRSWIGYASSRDGIHFERLAEPVLSPAVVPEEAKGVEDPRVIKFEDTYYMCYTAYDGSRCQIALASSRDLLHWEREGVIMSDEPFGWNKDASLFPAKFGGRWCLMHRPEPDIWLSFGASYHEWTEHRCIMQREFEWEATKIGGGAQPILTDAGWLLVYHGVDAGMCYRLGLALLDRDDPTKVLRRHPEPVLSPEEPWELRGDVANVVFSCGAVLLGHELWVYYGCADTVIGLAKGDVREFLG
jgi:predicted GH43/DUF377 family glycosyl hydrolase